MRIKSPVYMLCPTCKRTAMDKGFERHCARSSSFVVNMGTPGYSTDRHKTRSRGRKRSVVFDKLLPMH